VRETTDEATAAGSQTRPMSLDPMLLIRRWPERRPVVLAAAAAGSAGVLVAVNAASDPGLGALFVLPVTLASLELGLSGGLAAAVAAIAFVIVSGAIAPAVAVLAAAAIAGRFSDRMRGVHAREQRLLDSGLAMGAVTAHEQLPQAIAAAALRTPRAVGAEVRLAGAATVVAGRMSGSRTATDIVARGARLGRIVVAHRAPLEREDRGALELLALQAGLAADNQRLLAQEREAAALEAELRRVRDDLLEQRSGLGRLLDAQEDDRRRLAEALHEELAQVLAAVLLGLRMLRREDPGAGGGSLDELHAQIVGVLDDVRDMAGALRPRSLAQLGLVPALEALARDAHGGLSVEAADVPEPLPEPLRTGVYRLIESALSTARPGAPADVRLTATGPRLDLVVELDLEDAREPLAAARARAALMNGSLRAEPMPDGRTRALVRLPLQPLPAATAEPTGRVARTTVLPAADSTSS
jgi:signal transduction histidine kinase